ncbi:MAG: hypothetical protein Q9162_001430 [Coniocarpon cinnabarinum]
MGPAKSARIIPTFAPVRHPKRHQTRQRVDNLRGAMSHRTIRRLARRGGIVRISTSIYEEVQETVRKRIEEITHFLVLYVVAVFDGRQTSLANEIRTFESQDGQYLRCHLGFEASGYHTIRESLRYFSHANVNAEIG